MTLQFEVYSNEKAEYYRQLRTVLQYCDVSDLILIFVSDMLHGMGHGSRSRVDWVHVLLRICNVAYIPDSYRI